jgi:hypothetical protein
MLVPPTIAAKLLEREVTGQIRDYLQLKGWRSIRMQRTVVPGQFQSGEPGMADFLFVRYLKPGLAAALWVELKRPGGKLRPRQVEWIARERQRGGSVMVVEEFEEFERSYRTLFGWLHDGRLPGQIDFFMGANS